jgi:hypothetical protein
VDSRRTVVEKFQREENPDVMALTLFRLFGSAGRPDHSELPPASPKALTLRRAAAHEILGSLSQLVTPHGRLFVEGWRPGKDWLRPRDLAPTLVGFDAAQVLVFGLDADEQEALRGDEDFQVLIEDGTVVLFEDSLTAIVAELAETGELGPIDERLVGPDTITLEVVERTSDILRPAPAEKLKKVTIGRAEWRALNETFSILCHREIARPFEGTSTERYRAFREFLSRSPDLQLDRVSEFAFRRPLLDLSILPQVRDLLQSPSPQDQPLLIAGQSGVGKTTLMALLAVELRAAGIPVVFVRRGVVHPNVNQLDRFVQLLERAGVKVPTVLLYDGLLEGYEYLKLARSMGSRGRKVLVVGSTYADADVAKSPRHQAGLRPAARLVALKVLMTDEERALLIKHLSKFLPYDQSTLDRLARIGYDNFFATLYHLLDAARPRLREGLVQEIEREIDRLAGQLQAADPQVAPPSGMQLALLSALAGTIYEQFLAPNAAPDDSTELKQKVDRLIDSVMVAGRFDVPVPQSIALRMLGNEHRAYHAALRACRILIERDVAEGVCELTARQPLEAEIWCQRRLPEKEDQFRLIREMARTARASDMANDHSLELTFVADLLRSFGPQGRPENRTPLLYPRIAGVVEDLRQQHPRVSPRLLLIESNATREWIGAQEKGLRKQIGEGPLAPASAERIRQEFLPPIRKAEEGLRQAIDLVCPADSRSRLAPGAGRLLATLHTELACTLGTEQACLSLLSRSAEAQPGLLTALDTCFDEAARTWQRALLHDEDSVQAHDTACWILRDRLDGPALTPEREAELLARWEEVIEQYSALGLSEGQQDKLDMREAELHRARGSIDRFEAVLSRMEVRGALAVHSLRARFLVEDEGVEAARRYLEKNCHDFLLTDRSVLSCYYRLWWRSETREPSFFEHDSLTPAFNREQWRRLAELAQARLSLEGEKDNCMALFHLGWSLLQVGGQSARAKEVFDHLQTVSLESYRRGRTLALLTAADGTPVEFFGESRAHRQGNRGFAWVEDLRLEIPFSLYEFGDVGARPGRSIGPFHLALNYRGMFAQPTHRFTQRSP